YQICGTTEPGRACVNQTTNAATPVVPPAEVARRVAEYRGTAFERKAAPQVVYLPDQHCCPWPGCDYRIVGIHYRLDALGSPEECARWLAAWWQGPGLVARCPGCGNLVLFDVQAKPQVSEEDLRNVEVLPDWWAQTARLAMASV